MVGLWADRFERRGNEILLLVVVRIGEQALQPLMLQGNRFLDMIILNIPIHEISIHSYPRCTNVDVDLYL